MADIYRCGLYQGYDIFAAADAKSAVHISNLYPIKFYLNLNYHRPDLLPYLTPEKNFDW